MYNLSLGHGTGGGEGESHLLLMTNLYFSIDYITFIILTLSESCWQTLLSRYNSQVLVRRWRHQQRKTLSPSH